MPKIKRVTRKTLLIIGEGAHELAFLKHLKAVFGSSELEITIDASNGGSPYDVINTAVKFRNGATFDRKAVLLDSDVALTAQAIKLAKGHRLEVIQSSPVCLEGMLLQVLEKTVPQTSPLCKVELHPLLNGHPTQMASYAVLFHIEVLNMSEHAAIKRLCELMTAG
jgi:hypothetical protein